MFGYCRKMYYLCLVNNQLNLPPMKNYFLRKLDDSVNAFFAIHFLILFILTYVFISILNNPASFENSISACFFGFLLVFDVLAVCFIIAPKFFQYWIKTYQPNYQINSYKIVYNSYYKTYQVSHNIIGATIAEFNKLKEAKEYCEKG